MEKSTRDLIVNIHKAVSRRGTEVDKEALKTFEDLIKKMEAKTWKKTS